LGHHLRESLLEDTLILRREELYGKAKVIQLSPSKMDEGGVRTIVFLFSDHVGRFML